MLGMLGMLGMSSMSFLKELKVFLFLVCRDDDTTCLGSCSGAFGP